MFDYSKLRGRIVEKYGSISKFSEKLSKSRTSVDLKLNNNGRENSKFHHYSCYY